MKQSLSLRAGLSLTMTPALQQAIRLLQLSSLDLQLEIQQALESNVMLEATGEEGEAGSNENEEALAEVEAGDSEEAAELAAESASEASLDLNDDSAIPDENAGRRRLGRHLRQSRRHRAPLRRAATRKTKTACAITCSQPAQRAQLARASGVAGESFRRSTMWTPRSR